LRVLFGDAFKNPPRILELPVGAVSVDRPLEPTRQQLSASLGARGGVRATLRAAAGTVPTHDRKDKVALLATVANHLRRVGPSASRRAPRTSALLCRWPASSNCGSSPRRSVEPGWLPRPTRRLRDTVSGVILNAEVRPGTVGDIRIPDRDNPKPRMPWENARDLRAAGLKVAIRPAADDDLEDMLFVAGLFTAGGLSSEEVLRMLTVSPAEMLGVADRVGSLTAGKDADFVVLSGDPFATHTRVQTVYVNGQAAFTARAERKTTVIRASRVYTGTGDIIANGAVLVEGGTICALGRDVSTPPDAVLRRFDRASWCRLPRPGHRAGCGRAAQHAGCPDDEDRRSARQRRSRSGHCPAGGRHHGAAGVEQLGARPCACIQTRGQARVVQEPVAIRFAVTGNLTSQGPSLRGTLQPARLCRVLDEVRRRPGRVREEEAGVRRGEGQGPAGRQARREEGRTETAAAPEKRASSMRWSRIGRSSRARFPPSWTPIAPTRLLAVQIFRDEFNLRTVLLGAEDAFRMADLLAEKQVAVAIGPEMVRIVDREPINFGQVLANRNVPFGFQSKATTGAKTLPLAVQYAVRQGLSTDDALAGLTAAPAKFLSLENRWARWPPAGRGPRRAERPAVRAASRVLAVMIDGQWVYQEEDDR
jgi:hypothetical protein